MDSAAWLDRPHLPLPGGHAKGLDDSQMKSAWLAEVMIAAPQVGRPHAAARGYLATHRRAFAYLRGGRHGRQAAGVFGGREAVAMLSRHAALTAWWWPMRLPQRRHPSPADLHPAEAWRLMRDAMVSDWWWTMRPGRRRVLTEHGPMRHPACLERARSGSVASALRTERIDADATLDDALARLTGQKTDCLLVRENGAPAGLVGIEQLLAAFASKRRRAPDPGWRADAPLGEGIGESASRLRPSNAWSSRAPAR